MCHKGMCGNFFVCKAVIDSLRFLYTIILALDANFWLKNRIRSSDKADPGLHTGLAYFVPQAAYKSHILKYATQRNVSDLQ
jgi:hypothetical protein